MHLSLRSLVPVAILIGVVLSAAVRASGPAAAPSGATLTILFDNTSRQDGCAAGWGFSALVEGIGRTILFDAGAEEGIFRQNVDTLGADLARVDLVFISHDHGDHTGGLNVMLERKKGVPVLVPAGARAALLTDIRAKGSPATAVKDWQAIVPGVWSTGDLGQAIHEQALVVDTPRGLVVITGCAHPGIVSMLDAVKAARKKNIDTVLGGFHLNQTPADAVDAIISRFKALGVQRVGATHCTGDAATGQFRKAFGAGFIELGVGAKLSL